jgi:hypothetical protein
MHENHVAIGRFPTTRERNDMVPRCFLASAMGKTDLAESFVACIEDVNRDVFNIRGISFSCSPSVLSCPFYFRMVFAPLRMIVSILGTPLFKIRRVLLLSFRVISCIISRIFCPPLLILSSPFLQVIFTVFNRRYGATSLAVNVIATLGCTILMELLLVLRNTANRTNKYHQTPLIQAGERCAGLFNGISIKDLRGCATDPAW